MSTYYAADVDPKEVYLRRIVLAPHPWVQGLVVSRVNQPNPVNALKKRCVPDVVYGNTLVAGADAGGA